ncbi:unnamed protein product [Spirodela intermedia]|uniref:Uncharacterized protein n=1 Tax=Spirodela intermedia TaxID=51605 RepID=A0A7I8J6E9_SPIIN|nr:unnamed protein product [Spirodela intermedia]CAA6665818.1 unnamed protein product [Spirodela intermedia]
MWSIKLSAHVLLVLSAFIGSAEPRMVVAAGVGAGPPPFEEVYRPKRLSPSGPDPQHHSITPFS